jgi:SPP1 gp7 family putative phage head morphogenesis protein
MAKVKDLKTRSPDYWQQRFESLQNRVFKEGDKSLKDLNKLFKGAYKEMNDRIQLDYARYGVIKESPVFTTLADGTKVISGNSSKLVLEPKSLDVRLSKGTRYTALQNDLTEILNGMSKTQNQIMITSLSGVANDAYYGSMFEMYKGYGVGTSFNLLTKEQVLALIKHPVNGANFSERVWDNKNLLAKQVNETLKAGITQGISNGEMAKRLSSKMDNGLTVASRLIRTEVTNSLNQATKLSYENSGIVSQYKYLATLDNRTSSICQDLDGQVFDVKEASTGLNYPPMHPNCRSTTVAYFDDSAAGLTRVARGLGGEVFTVPGDMTYKEFRKKYT